MSVSDLFINENFSVATEFDLMTVYLLAYLSLFPNPKLVFTVVKIDIKSG